MYSYTWDSETGGLLLNSSPLQFSKEPRPVYYQELDILGFDKYWKYEKDDSAPYMWAEANNYIYKGRLVAQTKGGTYFSAPEIIIKESTVAEGEWLEHVDVKRMLLKNKEFFESFVAETIKNTYNTYLDFKDKVDIFHVSFSGGKDSEVTLDIVQRALPHGDFVVIFGDTGMEFPDTYERVAQTKEYCENNGIRFYVAKSHLNPIESWHKFGPPAATIRWCCSVHKTTPQLLLIRELLDKSSFTEMAFVGVRADESVRRSGYDYISYGTKHKGQYSCNPILNWNSAEVWLYIYFNNLEINKAYKRGNTRAGCLICPMSTGRNDFLNHTCYKEKTTPLLSIIKELNASDKHNETRLLSYVENNGWRARKNGRDLTISSKSYSESIINDKLVITLRRCEDWKQWIKTIGKVVINESEQCVFINTQGRQYTLYYTLVDDLLKITINNDTSASGVNLLKKIRHVFRKSHYCVSCKVCEANCKFGNITFQEGKPIISNKCIHCGECLDIQDGCYVYKSLWLSNGLGNMNKTSLDRYAAHGPKIEWFKEFLRLGAKFKSENTLGNNQVPMFYKFLRDSGLVNGDLETRLAEKLRETNMEDEVIWSIILVNLCTTSEVQWFIRNTNVSEATSQSKLISILSNTENVSVSALKSIPVALKRISQLPLSTVGFGTSIKSSSEDGGALFIRTTWKNPNDKVILYSLYKFAEVCDQYYQFTLSDLFNDTIERNGVSPTQIFGIKREEMTNILTGLSINYPEFISASFSLDLDNITLRENKTSEDVLNLLLS